MACCRKPPKTTLTQVFKPKPVHVHGIFNPASCTVTYGVHQAQGSACATVDSAPVNIRAGAMPPKEANRVACLKIAVDAL